MYQQIFGGYCWTFIKDRFTKFRSEVPDRGRTTICVPFSDRERNLNNSGILSMRTPTRTRQTMGEMPIGLESLVLGAIAIKVRGVWCFVAYYNIQEPKLTCGSHQYMNQLATQLARYRNEKFRETHFRSKSWL